MVGIVVNGTACTVDGDDTVAALVGRFGWGSRGVAVAINQTVVPRSAWSARRLAAGDRVEVLNPAPGG